MIRHGNVPGQEVFLQRVHDVPIITIIIAYDNLLILRLFLVHTSSTQLVLQKRNGLVSLAVLGSVSDSAVGR